jgi:hypothetical protein
MLERSHTTWHEAAAAAVWCAPSAAWKRGTLALTRSGPLNSPGTVTKTEIHQAYLPQQRKVGSVPVDERHVAAQVLAPVVQHRPLALQHFTQHLHLQTMKHNAAAAADGESDRSCW